MAINQITKIRMPDGEEIALVDWSDRPLYSTVDLFDGFTDEEIRLFAYGDGDTVSSSSNLVSAARRVATLRDTNISGSSELDSTEEYLVYEIKAEIHLFDLASNKFSTAVAGYPVPSAPLMGILQNALVLELEVSEKAFPQAGLGWFAAGFGVSGFSSSATRSFANNGSPGHDASYKMSIPVHIGGTEDYAVILHNPGAEAVIFRDDAAAQLTTGVVQIRTYLNGLHKRPTA